MSRPSVASAPPSDQAAHSSHADLANALENLQRIHELAPPRVWQAVTLRIEITRYALEHGYGAEAGPAEPTVTPDATLRAAGVSSKRQAAYQRKMSTLLAGREAASTRRPRRKRRAARGERG